MCKLNKVLDSFMNSNSEYLDEYLIEKTYKHLKNREDYYNLKKEKSEIFNQYPELRNLFENSKLTGMSKEEIKAMDKIFCINEMLTTLEKIEAFKMGAKEAYIFFEEQDMLNI